MAHSMRLTARLCWALDARQWLLLAADAAGGGLFVVGCVAFYAPSQYVTGVTLFLLGSLLMLVSTVGRALVQYGPAE